MINEIGDVGGWMEGVPLSPSKISKILIRVCVGCFLQHINYGTLDTSVQNCLYIC
jgi:hypothetical protein